MLSYSRGALVALRGRRRRCGSRSCRCACAALVALAAAVLGAAPVIAWAFSQDGLTTDRAPLAARVDAGHEFGALLVLMARVLLAAGLAVQFAAAQRPPTPRARRLAGRGALAVLALVPVWRCSRWRPRRAARRPGLEGLGPAHRPDARTPANTPGRLTATSSVRARYWREALDVHATEPWLGTGAGAYATVRTRFRDDALAVRHAHGYVVQTLADLGWVGLVAVAAGRARRGSSRRARATGLRRRDRGLPFDAERIGLLTLAVVVLVFAVHSLVDWTWFVPANAGVALLCAGWVAGRGPLRARLEGPRGPRRRRALRGRTRAGSRRLGQRVPPLRGARRRARVFASRSRRRGPPSSPCARCTPATRRSTGSTPGSRRPRPSIATIATDRNPLSRRPAVRAGRDRAGARAHAGGRGRARARRRPAARERRDLAAARRVPAAALNDPQGALSAFQAAYYLDPQSPASTSDVLEASRAGASGAAPCAVRPARSSGGRPTAARALEARRAERARQRRRV